MEATESGLDALVRTLALNDVALVTGVYGDPTSAVLDALIDAQVRVEISAEERSALSQALGASVAGRRSAVAIKHVGVLVASDPLVTAIIHGIGAGLVVIAGDDPGAQKSSNEQDSRWFGPAAGLPVLTPQDPDRLAWAVCEAFEVSELHGIPVMLHITRRLLESVGTAGSYRATGSGRFERDRTWQQLPLDRQKDFLQRVAPALLERAENVHAAQPASTAKEGVISCGYASSLVSHDRHLALAYAHPLAEAVLVDFLSTLDRVLVVEDTAPVIETGVRAVIGAQQLAVRPLGRLTGHLPRIGPLSQENIATAFERQPNEPDFDVLARPSGAVFQLRCGGFEPLYHALDAQLPSDQWVAGDVGCSSVHGYLPPQVIDTAYALGTSIATASGLSLSGHKGVAVIGDVGFLHSGLTSLLGAVEHGHDLLVIVLCNGIAAMTPGTQNTPGMAKIRRLVEACDPTAITEIDIDTASADRIGEVVHDALAASGVQVILASAEPKTFG